VSDLVDILRTHREAICEAFVEKVCHAQGKPVAEADADSLRGVVDALIAYLGNGQQPTARAWADELLHRQEKLEFEARRSRQATRLESLHAQVLAELAYLEQIVRFHIVKELSHKKSLLAALNQLGEAVDLVRCLSASARSEIENRHQIERYEFIALAENSDDFICLANLQGKPFYLNKAARLLADVSSSRQARPASAPGEDLSICVPDAQGKPCYVEIPSTSLRDYCSDESWSELRDVAVPAVKKAGRWQGRSRLCDLKSGKMIDVDTAMFLVRSPRSEKPACLAIVHRRTGHQEEIEEALAESEARKRAILESGLDPIITIDHEGVITEFNRAAEQVFGHPREKVLGKPPSEILFPPEKIAGHRNRIDRYLDAGEGSMLGKRVEVTAVRANGETFPAEMAMVINQQRGAPVLTFFVRDISQRKQAEREQARFAEELQRSNRELEQFAYVASHDLQEPLRKIRTFADRLEMKCGEALDETGSECLNRMQDAAARMQTLINDLLMLSRVTTKGQEFVPVDLTRIAQEVVSDLEVQIEQAGGQVEVGKLPTIQADPLQIRQLLQNLIGNALKFHREDEPPMVKIHGRFVRGRRHRRAGESPAEEKCRIVVEDNGIGFDEKYLDRIFDVFQRLHSRDVYRGTGVGLAICRKIAERHGGTVTAESTLGKGSTFTVVLPVVHHKETR